MSAVTPIPIKLYPRLAQGRFNRWRVACVLLTQLFFFGAPWLQWQGRQALWFDFVHSRFYLFGLVLWPQDFIYVAALLIFCALALFWWTALAGRLWCGFSCPQTVYSEIMLWIERAFEGDRLARMRLDAAPWGLNKLMKKAGSHSTMIAFSLVTGFTYVGWFMPIRQMAAALPTGALSGWQWFWLLCYGGITYLFAGRLRENVCKHMCPYARFQSVMFDADTLVVSYDAVRGEPRGALKKAAAAPKGDCVDCKLCVQVCPTGIDIRNGLQYECIGCAACIDVCDTVMDKIAAPRGLIRFSTENALHGKVGEHEIKHRLLRPRVLIYGSLMLAVLVASLIGLALREPFKLDVLRDRAFLVRETDNGWLENVYTVHVANTRSETRHIRLGVEGMPLIRLAEAPVLVLQPGAETSVQVRVRALPDYATRGSHPIRIVASALEAPGEVSKEKTSFIGE